MRPRQEFDSQDPELMDRPQPVSAELAETLRQLEFMNRHFGGHRYLRRFLRARFVAGESYRVLDLATGGGDFPRAMLDWARPRGIRLEIDAVDANAAIVTLASGFSTAYPEIRCLQSDARTFVSETPYDLVHCSLSLHHFASAEAAALLRRWRELSRRYVLITDLERRPTTLLGVQLINRVLRHNSMTIQDGDTSARRAFSFDEAHTLAEKAGWPRFGHERFLFCRQALWLPA